jgi:hypothetical protein
VPTNPFFVPVIFKVGSRLFTQRWPWPKSSYLCLPCCLYHRQKTQLTAYWLRWGLTVLLGWSQTEAG